MKEKLEYEFTAKITMGMEGDTSDLSEKELEEYNACLYLLKLLCKGKTSAENIIKLSLYANQDIQFDKIDVEVLDEPILKRYINDELAEVST